MNIDRELRQLWGQWAIEECVPGCCRAVDRCDFSPLVRVPGRGADAR